MECPFGEDVGASPHLTHCRWWPVCSCLGELLRHSIGMADDQTGEVAAWWEEHYDGETKFARRRLPRR